MNESMIINIIIEQAICADEKSAINWYRTVPIQSFSNKTEKQIVKLGKIESLVSYLKRIVHGGYA